MKKLTTRFLAFFLSLLMGISLIPQNGMVVYAAAKPKLLEKSASIVVGQTTKLKAKNVPKDAVVSYKSAKKNIATVTEKGKVKGVRAGTTKVTVYVKSGSATTNLTYKVTVKKPALSLNKLSLTEGDKVKLSVKNKPKSASYTWTSSNETVATVSKTGKVKAMSAGTTMIKLVVKTENKTYNLSCKLTVNAETETSETSETETFEKYYTVTFDSNGGSEVKPYTIVSNGKVTQPTDPTRSGYTFEGWYTEESGGEKFDFNTAITGNVTVFAHWRSNGSGGGGGAYRPPIPSTTYFSVTFNSNGGSAVDSQTVVSDSKVMRPTTDPTREGYIFNGWYTEESGGQEFDFNTAIIASITLYAHWTIAEIEPPEAPISIIPTGEGSSVDVYSISSLSIDEDNRVAIAKISAPENCMLLIRFLDENLYFSSEYPDNKNYILEESLYAAHVVRAGTDMEDIVADVVGDIPAYYVAEAILLNGEGIPLCNPYTDIQHTTRYEEFQKKTVFDFNEDAVVLNFDDNIENNFGVLSSDVKCVTGAAITLNYVDGTYYMTGATEAITPGDKIFIRAGVETALIRVKSIKVEGDVLEITPADAEDEFYGFDLEDFYSYIKVDMVYDGNVDSGGIAEDTFKNLPFLKAQVVDVDIKGETSLSINPITFETEHFRASGKVSGKISGTLVMEWDLHIFGKDYMRCDFTYSTDMKANLSLSAKFGTENNEELQNKLKDLEEKREISLGRVKIPFGVTGLDAFADIDVWVQWKITAGLELSGDIKTTHGFKYNTKDGYQKVDKKENSWAVDLKGHGEIKFGPSPKVGVEFLGGVIKANLECFLGAQVEGDAIRPVFQGGTSKHGCDLCIDGKLDMVISVDAKLKYKITNHLKGTPIDLNIVSIKRPLFEFYGSLINSSDSMFGGKVNFGIGSCPNKSYKTTFNVINDNDMLYNGVSVTISSKKTNTCITVVENGHSVFLFAGNYSASAIIDGNMVTRSFTVSSVAQTVTLKRSTCDGSIVGVVKNASSQASIEGATIEVYQGSVRCGVGRTVSDGSYKIDLPEGNYKYVISAEGFVESSGYFSLVDGETKYMETTMMAKDNDSAIMGGIFGVISDARTGRPLSGVKVQIYSGINNTTGTSSATDFPLTTNGDGVYSYKSWSIFGIKFGLPAGNYTVVLSKEDYITTSFDVVIVGGEDIEYNGTIAPVSMDNEYRVVLTWGEHPYDLDSHYITATNDGSIVHVYFQDMDGITASLDTDDTDSYGPETVYITNFDSLINGFYYCVHDYTNRDKSDSHALGASAAMVKLYKGAELLATYYVPSGQGGTVWNVFSINANGVVTPINTMGYESTPSYVGNTLI